VRNNWTKVSQEGRIRDAKKKHLIKTPPGCQQAMCIWNAWAIWGQKLVPTTAGEHIRWRGEEPHQLLCTGGRREKQQERNGGGNPLGTMADNEGEGSVCEQDKRGKGRSKTNIGQRL